MLEIIKGLFAIGKCVYLLEQKAIIISDLHLGYEEHMAKKGTLLPRFQYRDIIKELEWVFGQVSVKTVVLNGDIKHEFGTVSNQEWREATRLVRFLREKRMDVIAVKGNHDTVFGPVASKLKVKEVRELRLNGILIAHGDYVPEKLAPLIIIGHAHPAVTLREEAKSEKYKCFVKMPFRKSIVICQPSFNPLTVGTDITSERQLSPLLKNVGKGEVYVVDDKSRSVLNFGPVKNF